MITQKNNNRHRRRSNTKEGVGRIHRVVESRTIVNRPRRKDWTERKSLSQGAKADGESKNNQRNKEKDNNPAHKRTRSTNCERLLL
ncbi:hypothetical protein COOONC_06484 [Cooperia oncophora]